jgi:hypothetical protein
VPVVLGLLALLVGMAPNNGPGQSSGCSPGVSVDVAAASTPGKPRRVATNAGVVCPTPEAPAGSNFGGGKAQVQQQGGTRIRSARSSCMGPYSISRLSSPLRR